MKVIRTIKSSDKLKKEEGKKLEQQNYKCIKCLKLLLKHLLETVFI